MAGKRDAEVIDFLDQWVLQDGQPITARLLSVKRRMNIGEAHRIMAEFYAQASERGPDSMPFTTWIIKGMLKDAPADSQHSSDSMDVDDEGSAPSLVKETLLLVADDKVQETERSFERVDAKEVYSFSPRLASKSQTAHKVAAISQLTTIHHDLRSTKEYVDVWESTEGGAQLGTIRAAVAWKEAGKRAAETKAGPSKPATSNMAAAAAPARPIKRESQSESKQVDKKPADKSVAGKSEGLDWSKAKTSSAKAKRKLADSDDEPDEGDESMANAEDDNDEEDDSGPIGYAEESPAAQSNVAIEHGGASRKRGDEAAKVSAQEKERQRRKQELMEMMDEDDGGETEPSAKTAGTSTSTVFGTIEEEPEDTGMEGKSTEEIGAEDNSEPAVNPSKRRVRKQRKVIRKETTKDAKGYRRTVDVEAYESYSSDEDDTAPKPTAKKSSTKGLTEPLAKDAVPKTATAAAKKGAVSGQRKLSSFFAKG